LEWTSYNDCTSIPVIDRHPVAEIYQVQDAIHIRSVEAVRSVNIYTIAGMLISRTQQQTMISMQKFMSGIYLIEILLNNGERVVKKFLYQSR
jgi:hypothetical protein